MAHLEHATDEEGNFLPAWEDNKKNVLQFAVWALLLGFMLLILEVMVNPNSESPEKLSSPTENREAKD